MRVGRPRGDSGPATCERLLVAAEREFARAGFAGARLGAIARAAGVRAPSLLHHFPTKEALYEAVVLRAFTTLGQALSGVMARKAALGPRVEELARAFEETLAAHPTLAPLMLRELLEGRGTGRDILMDQIAPLLDSVESHLRRGGARRGVPLRAGVMAVVSTALLAAASGTLRTPLWGRGRDNARLARLIFAE